MSAMIPLIRAAALVPLARWMAANGRSVEQRLAAADLGYVALDNPMLPIPARNAAIFFRDAGRADGPDIGCRAIAETSLLELAMIGKVALGARSPHEALLRVASAMPYHCSHEHVFLRTRGDSLWVTDGWSLEFDPETLHIIHQHSAAFVQVLCRLAEPALPAFEAVELCPHPTAGLTHLVPWLGDRVVAASTKALTLVLSNRVADQPFRQVMRDRSAQIQAAGLVPLDRFDGLSASVRGVISIMLSGGVPTIEQLAASAGMSRRTLQRRLAEENTSFSSLLEEARQDLALDQISVGRGPLTAVSANLGYSRQSSLTRAVRRWTGRTPKAVRGPGVQQDGNTTS